MQTQRVDLVILGSGSTAYAAAIRAAELGKTAAMTENRTLGGTCVNCGCLPSKNLIAAAGIIHDAAYPRYPGIEPARLRFNFSELIRQKDEVIAYYRDKKIRASSAIASGYSRGRRGSLIATPFRWEMFASKPHAFWSQRGRGPSSLR
jgi:pyruvate/2-oxoglutarate dehydrogenase complex dihydrolipoamide dehydrogenase (E3) component